jgi:hypothetical protein
VVSWARPVVCGAAALFCGWAASCGGSTSRSTPPGTGEDAAPDTTSDGSADDERDAAFDTSGDAPSGDAQDTADADAAETGPQGYIEFDEYGAGYGWFRAAFGGNVLFDADYCSTASYGSSCIVITCPISLPPDAGSSPAAGTLTLSGGRIDGGVIVDAGPPLGRLGEYDWDPQGPFFYPGDGEVLGVQASGGEVPAFGEQTVVGPEELTVTAPALPTDGGVITVSTSQDFITTWTGGQAGSRGSVEAYGFTATTSPHVFVYCEVDAASHQVTIPMGALAALAGSTKGAFLWGNSNVTRFQDGVWAVRLMATSYVTTNATFQ